MMMRITKKILLAAMFVVALGLTCASDAYVELLGLFMFVVGIILVFDWFASGSGPGLT